MRARYWILSLGSLGLLVALVLTWPALAYEDSYIIIRGEGVANSGTGLFAPPAGNVLRVWSSETWARPKVSRWLPGPRHYGSVDLLRCSTKIKGILTEQALYLGSGHAGHRPPDDSAPGELIAKTSSPPWFSAEDVSTLLRDRAR